MHLDELIYCTKLEGSFVRMELGYMRILCQMDLFVCNEIGMSRNLLSNRLICVNGIGNVGIH